MKKHIPYIVLIIIGIVLIYIAKKPLWDGIWFGLMACLLWLCWEIQHATEVDDTDYL